MKKEVVNELVARGCQVEERTTSKNGVDFIGLVVGKSENIRPTFYWQDSFDSMTVNEVADIIAGLYEKHKMQDVNATDFTSQEYLKENTFVALQRSCTEDAAHRNYMDMVLVLRCKALDGTYIVPSQFANDDIWECALNNTLANATFKGLAETIGMPDMEEPLYILSNTENAFGAFFNADLLKRFCEEHSVESCYILPSSIHEVLINTDMSHDMEMLSAMVSEINETQVDEFEQLSNHAYRYDLETNEITY